MKCWNDLTKEEVEMPRHSPTNESLRNPSQYNIVSDAQLKRDLRGRTISDVYRENRARRTPNTVRRDYNSDLAAYQAWLSERKHVPHPASIDPEHPIAKQREGLRYVAKV